MRKFSLAYLLRTFSMCSKIQSGMSSVMAQVMEHYLFDILFAHGSGGRSGYGEEQFPEYPLASDLLTALIDLVSGKGVVQVRV
jgi:hypothetical protein